MARLRFGGGLRLRVFVEKSGVARGAPPQTATRFRHAAQAWTRSGLAWETPTPASLAAADPSGVPSGGMQPVPT